jgi:hypothetical protein
MDGWDLATVWFIHRAFVRSTMAKTDSFFIRASVTTQNDGSFDQASIDLGSYVDALAKSVLRVHNLAVTVANDANNLPPSPGAVTADLAWQLTTQSQSALVRPTDRSVISSGALVGTSPGGAIYDVSDMLPQTWTNGYLVGVEQIYLGALASANWSTNDITVSVVMECTVESLSQSSAMALALSQQ